MELMQLEMFVAVVEECSVKKAAERVFRTQPAVSLALGKLEREIGTPLLERRPGQRRRLTPAGELLYECASRIIFLRNEVALLLKGQREGSAGRLRIGVNRAGNLQCLSQLTNAFTDRYPHVRLEVLSDSAANLVRDLVGRVIDLVLLFGQPQLNREPGDFVITAVSGLRREHSFWIVQHRTGRPHLAVVLEETLLSSSTPSANTHHGKKRKSESCATKPCMQKSLLRIMN
jgi:DNA-binding transcriptional LysR family regulator